MITTTDFSASAHYTPQPAAGPADPLLNRHHQLYVIAAGNIVMAGFGVMWFGQTARFPLTPGSTILIVLSGGFLVAGLCAIVAGLATRVQGRQERDVVTEIQRHIDEATAGGVQTIGRVADVEATVTRIEAVVEERLRVLVDASAEQRQTLGELETRVQEGRKEGRKSAEVLDESFLKVGARVDEVRQLIEGRLVELQRVGQLVAAGLGELERRVEVVERRSGHLQNFELLRGLTAWAIDIDHRLAALQRASDPAFASATGGNGDGATNGKSVSPMELSDEALRGYFLGFYDRERGDGGPAPA